MLNDKIVRVRMVKNYSTAHNHLAIGQVLEETPTYIRMNCRIFHFANRSGRLVGESEIGVRILPWLRIEVIAELPSATDWKKEAVFDRKNNFVLLDDNQTLIARASQGRQHAQITN
ncbi:MAG: hypothetical protein A2283_17910 [Lentisphaerae bacterium RIFOXYA12_FULL_48_11]|nr:MAG: hypothetical protein A2283_17910 [Lentisphaerae bacterium RIFOXYA12_FULL_48_11]